MLVLNANRKSSCDPSFRRHWIINSVFNIVSHLTGRFLSDQGSEIVFLFFEVLSCPLRVPIVT